MTVLEKGDVVHVITRRGFNEDHPRHFVGQVIECAECVARVRGFPFILDTTSRTFVRKKRERTRLVPLTDAGMIITVLPNDIRLDQLRYEDVEGHLVLTDGRQLKLDFSEYRIGA